ncbi:hypothetical protein GALL_446960 [mine drainage metagenome]|uniref:NAD-specific glutamate dehydrogenase n=1 Tax=mine drainage metagenome TaxID=410659 RepID=A0A1J5Q0W1_9ZZZZ
MAGRIVKVQLGGVDLPVFDAGGVHVDLESVHRLDDVEPGQLRRLTGQVPVAQPGQCLPLHGFQVAVQSQAELGDGEECLAQLRRGAQGLAHGVEVVELIAHLVPLFGGNGVLHERLGLRQGVGADIAPQDDGRALGGWTDFHGLPHLFRPVLGVRGLRDLKGEVWDGLWTSALTALQIQRRLRQQGRCGLEALEAHVLHHAVFKRGRSLGEVLRNDVGIGLVQGLLLPGTGIGHAQHAAEQLLHVLGRVHRLQRGQHIGEGAIPAFLERFYGDDVPNRAGTVEQVDAVEFLLCPGGHRDLALGDVLFIEQVLAHHIDRGLIALGCRLDQDDGADVVGLRLRRGLQLVAGANGVGHTVAPTLRMLGQHDRQLDHLLGLQLLGAHMVQHVVARNRRGGEFDDAARVHPPERLEEALGAVVVRFVHDDHRALQVQPVRHGILHPPNVLLGQVGLAHQIGGGDLLQPLRELRRQVVEVRGQFLEEGVDVALRGVADVEGLDGGHHHDGRLAHVLRADGLQAVEVTHLHAIAEGLGERLAVGVAHVGQGVDGLGADGVGGGEPQRHGGIGVEQGARCRGDAVGSQQGFAAACGDAQADGGRVAEDRLVGNGAFLSGQSGGECRGHRLAAAALQKRGERIKGLLLVGLEGEHDGQRILMS